MLSRRRSEASSKPSPGGVFYGPAEVQMGFSRELRKGEGKPGAARREEGFVHTRRGCLTRKQKFGAKFTGCFGVYGRLLNLFEGVM